MDEAKYEDETRQDWSHIISMGADRKRCEALPCPGRLLTLSTEADLNPR